MQFNEQITALQARNPIRLQQFQFIALTIAEDELTPAGEQRRQLLRGASPVNDYPVCDAIRLRHLSAELLPERVHLKGAHPRRGQTQGQPNGIVAFSRTNIDYVCIGDMKGACQRVVQFGLVTAQQLGRQRAAEGTRHSQRAIDDALHIDHALEWAVLHHHAIFRRYHPQDTLELPHSDLMARHPEDMIRAWEDTARHACQPGDYASTSLLSTLRGNLRINCLHRSSSLLSPVCNSRSRHGSPGV